MASANGKSFLNMATGGFGTEAAKQTDSDLKDKVGGAAYLITGEPTKVLSPLSAGRVVTLHAFHMNLCFVEMTQYTEHSLVTWYALPGLTTGFSATDCSQFVSRPGQRALLSKSHVLADAVCIVLRQPET